MISDVDFMWAAHRWWRLRYYGANTPISKISGLPSPAQSQEPTAMPEGDIDANMIEAGVSALCDMDFQMDSYSSIVSKVYLRMREIDPDFKSGMIRKS